MFGPDNDFSNYSTPHIINDQSDIDWVERSKTAGLVLRSIAEVLRAKYEFASRNINLTVRVQYAEIYNEKVTDLLSGHRIQVRRSNGELVGATSTTIENLQDAISVLTRGNTRKHFAATAMNDRSSRAHTVFVIELLQSRHNNNPSMGNHDIQIKSHLYLVDLAGSERTKKSKVLGTHLDEANAINSSLLVLGKVISKLSKSEYHIPYYESQLTTLLKGAFGGNSRTAIVITCRSDDVSYGDETLQSLRFGEQCSMISNATIKAASSVADVQMMLDESINAVTLQLRSLEMKGKHTLPTYQSLQLRLYELKRRKEIFDEDSSNKSILV
jgi:hypothetical protein